MKQKSSWSFVSMFLSLSRFALDIFATGKRVNHEGEYGQVIPVNFHFYGPEKTIKLAKKKLQRPRKT